MLPIDFPNRKKNSMQETPTEKQMNIIFLQKFFKRETFEEADKFATVVSESADREFVSADGKKIHGKAIPVKTPYRASDSFEVNPLIHNILGMEIAS